MTTVTHIVPLFAPVIDGVGDYALHLARTLRANHAIESRFVVADPIWKGAAEVDGFSISGPTSFDTQAMMKELGRDAHVLLHYVGYGYHRKGVPVWLIDAIEQWPRKNAGARLITIFHEIWSSGPPWRSTFYLRPTQRRLVGRLLEASAHAFANTVSALAKLEQIKRATATFLPVSANILPAREPTPHPRGSELYQPLVFGQPWTRLATVKKHSDLLRALHSQRLLQRVLVVGHGTSGESEDVIALRSVLPNEKIFIGGEKSSEQAAEIFDEADFLLSPGRASDLCKSSAAMAAFACGCPVVISGMSGSESPEPLGPEHFIVVRDTECELRNVSAFALRKWNLQRVAVQARAWFLENATWPKLAEQIAAKLLDQRSVPTLRK